MDVALIRPAAHDCHASDLSAVVDLGSERREQIGIGGKQRVEVGHHAVLPDEGMGPVEVGVPVASHYLALAVDAEGYAPNISRQEVEDCECAILPKRAGLGLPVSTADCSNNLALVVIAPGLAAILEVRKRGGNAVFPRGFPLSFAIESALGMPSRMRGQEQNSFFAVIAPFSQFAPERSPTTASRQ